MEQGDYTPSVTSGGTPSASTQQWDKDPKELPPPPQSWVPVAAPPNAAVGSMPPESWVPVGAPQNANVGSMPPESWVPVGAPQNANVGSIPQPPNPPQPLNIETGQPYQQLQPETGLAPPAAAANASSVPSPPASEESFKSISSASSSSASSSSASSSSASSSSASSSSASSSSASSAKHAVDLPRKYPCGKGIPPANCAYCPPRSNAFYAPKILVRDLEKGRFSANVHSSGHANEVDEKGSVNFGFHPRPDYGTQVTLSVEPRKQPYWKTMMQCGFIPMINCGVSPSYLSSQGGMMTMGGRRAPDSDSSESETDSETESETDSDSSDSEETD